MSFLRYARTLPGTYSCYKTIICAYVNLSAKPNSSIIALSHDYQCHRLHSVSTRNKSPLNQKDESSDGQAKPEVNYLSSPDEIAKMRTRMAELHGLPQTPASGTHGKLSVSKTSSTESEALPNPFVTEMDNESDNDPEDSSIATGAEFIRNVGKPDQQDSESEVIITMPFGQIRFDSMNKPKAESIHDDIQEEAEYESDTEYDVENFAFINSSRPPDTSIRQQMDRTVERVGNTKKRESQTPTPVTPFDHTSDAGLHNRETLLKSTAAEKVRSGSVIADLKSISQNKVSKSPDVIFFDEQFFGSRVSSSTREKELQRNEAVEKNVSIETANVFDEQYFGSHLSPSTGKLESKKQTTEVNVSNERSNIFEEQYFSKNEGQPFDLIDVASSQNSSTNSSVHEISKLQEVLPKNPNPPIVDPDVPLVRSASRLSHSFQLEETSYSRLSDADANTDAKAIDDGDTLFVEPVTKRELKARTRPIADTENPRTAYDLAVKLRLEKQHKVTNTEEMEKQKEKGTKGEKDSVQPETGKKSADVMPPRLSKWTGRKDSKGFRILEDQVVDVNTLTQEDMVSILKDSVLFEDDKLFVIDKPYGLPSHGGPGVQNSVGRLLEPLAARIDRSGKLRTLHLVHRLDKETTGVMVLAKSVQVAELLLAMFKKRQVIKHYWVITKGIPNPPEGVIDIPMAEGVVDNRYRMELRPVHSSEDGFRKKLPPLGSGCSEAVTNYRVLSSYGGAALVECTPETGVKHQIRCHLAFGLNTPILGDHKYSHMSKIAPQRLYPEILQLLGVRQAKVRHIPMHLHAKAVVLPEWMDGRNLFLSARLPKHFVQNMKWLRLKPPG